MKRYMSLDIGDRTIGIAVSDLLGLTAQGVETIRRKSLEDDLKRLGELMDAYETKSLVSGLPKNMDGTEGPRAEKARQFKALLEEASGMPVILWDERRSTIEAHAILHAAGKKEKKHRANVDAVAATLLLEGYLASGK